MTSGIDAGRWDVSRETQARLETYVAELRKWQKAINLIGPDTVGEIWERHILDSLQLLPLLKGARRVADLGSGAGLPGMVLAIAYAAETGGSVDLVESNAKKAAFLRQVIVLTGAKAEVHNGRIEAVLPRLSRPDVITARALAPLAQLLTWTEPLLISGTAAFFHKGRDLQSELQDASRFWDIDHDVIPSVVAESSCILKVTAIRRRNAG